MSDEAGSEITSCLSRLLAEVAAAMRQRLGGLIRRAGMQLMQLMLEQEVEQVVGGRYRPCARRQAYLQRDPQFHLRLEQQTMRGLSTRSYGPTLRRLAEAHGIDKTVVAGQFVEASRPMLRQLMERRLETLDPQRCQLHRRRNVLAHLPGQHQPFLEQKLVAAWRMFGYAEARQALQGCRRNWGGSTPRPPAA